MISKVEQFRVAADKPYRLECFLSITASVVAILFSYLFIFLRYPLEAEYNIILFSYPYVLDNPAFIFVIANLFSLMVPYLFIISLWTIGDSDEIALIVLRSQSNIKSFLIQIYVMLITILLTISISSLLFSIIFRINFKNSLLYFLAHLTSILLTACIARLIHAYTGLQMMACGLVCFIAGYALLLLPFSVTRMFSSLYPLYLLSSNEMEIIYIPFYVFSLLFNIQFIIHKEKTKDYLGG